MGRLASNDRIASALIQWGSGSLRDLPWRRTNDAWQVLVSEIMLQQTSVARVLPKYEAFLDAFPDAYSLANAPLGDALRLWTGLGYPRRCRNLHSAAQVIVSEYDGVIPNDLDLLLALPGIGQYTARAVMAFAFHSQVAVVDVNVSRVLSRLRGEPMKAKDLQVMADELVPLGLSWEWNQVMMDFGARQCVVRTPDCASCPLQKECTWHGDGNDPAPQSAGASKPQARFEGSDRQARGRAMKFLNSGARNISEVVEAMGVDPQRAQSLIEDLIAEQLIVKNGQVLTLP